MPNVLTTLVAVSALAIAANANTWRRLDDHDTKCPDSEGTNHCKDPPATKNCAALEPFIKEGGCYRECAKEWNSTSRQDYAAEYDCSPSHLENLLTDQCPGENNNECGFEMTGCNTCDKGPDEDKKQCDTIKPFLEAGGCYSQCAAQWPDERIKEVAKEWKCEDGEMEKWLGKGGPKCAKDESKCEMSESAGWFQGGCHDCTDGPKEDSKCKDVLPFIEKGGCYRQCAEGWSTTHLEGVAKQFDCDDGEIEETLGRLSEKEADKMVKDADCKSSEMYCGPAENQGAGPYDWIEGFEGSCHDCKASPKDCKEAIKMMTDGGCYSDCAVGWTTESREDFLTSKDIDCDKDDLEEVEELVEDEQKRQGLRSAGHGWGLHMGAGLAMVVAALW